MERGIRGETLYMCRLEPLGLMGSKRLAPDRTEREIEASLTREVTQERWTSLDAAIRQELTHGVIDVNTWTADAPEILRAMGERGDIVRTLQRAIGGRQGEQDPCLCDAVDDFALPMVECL